MAAKSKRVTIKQVAEEAGVSTQTISRVVNNRPDVSPETRRRVKQAIEKLGYRPDTIARSLIQGRTQTLGVIAYGLEYFGPSQTLGGIDQEANKIGYSLRFSLLHRLDEASVRKHLWAMMSHRVDGVIWAVPDHGDGREWVMAEAAELPVPIVLLTTEARPGISTVAVDNLTGGRLATEHLLEQGYRRIGLITGPQYWWEARQRARGWRMALQAAGVEVPEHLVAEGDWTAASGEHNAYHLFDQSPAPDALFVSNDQMALGVLRAAQQAGLRVPDDLGIVGFDDIPEAAYFFPPLTTVRQQIFDLGRYAVKELQRRIELPRQRERDGEVEVKPENLILPPKLIVRKSSIRQA